MPKRKEVNLEAMQGRISQIEADVNRADPKTVERSIPDPSRKKWYVLDKAPESCYWHRYMGLR